MAYGSHQRISGTKVNTHGQPMLVRCSGHAGFGDLKQGHDVIFIVSGYLVSQ